MALLCCAINEIRCSVEEDGALALFFVPTPADLTVQESPSPGICHPRQKTWNRLMHEL